MKKIQIEERKEICPLPNCKNKELESIIDNEGFVIHYYCCSCYNNWNWEDLPKIKKIKQDTLSIYFRKE